MQRAAWAAALLLLCRAQQPLPEVPLDMAPDAFDDEYRGCAGAMEAALPALHRSEMATNSIYAAAWTAAAAAMRERRRSAPPRLPPLQETALLAYTMQSPLHGAFNAAVRTAGASPQRYRDAFAFKSLHLALSRALQALRGAGRCVRCHRGVQGLRFAARARSAVRFGHFASCSRSAADARRFGADTFFSLQTCHGAPIREFSFFPAEEEVLVPPSEVFLVTNVSRVGGGVFIELHSLGLNSSYNCELLRDKHCKGQPCVFNTARSDPEGFQHLWVLLLALGALVPLGH